MFTDNSSAQTSAGSGPGGIDRRKQPRVSILGEGLGDLIIAELNDCSGGLILDLGAGGMSIQVAGPEPPSLEFKVHFKLGHGASAIEGKARPAWHDDSGRFGICFVALADEAHHQLKEWLNSKTNIPQRETVTVSQQLAAAPLIAAPHDTLSRNDGESLGSKLARVYSALPPHQRLVARRPDNDALMSNSEGDSTLTERAGESELVEAECEEQNRSSHQPCGVGCPEPEESIAEFESLPRIPGSVTKLTAVPARETNAPQPMVPAVATVPETGSDGERASEVSTVGRIVAQAHEMTHADGAALALVEPNGTVICKASLGKAPEVGAPLKPGAGLSGECIRTGGVVSCEDSDLDLRVPFAISRDLGLKSIVIIPIRTNGKTAGVLEVTSCAKAAFTSDHIAALQQLANEAASSLASTLYRASPSLAGFRDMCGGPTPDFGEDISARTAATLSTAITHESFSTRDREAGHVSSQVAAIDPLTGLTSSHDPGFAQSSEHRESTEELVSKLRAASSREVGIRSGHSQPISFLRDKYTNLVLAAKSLVHQPGAFASRFLTLGRPVLWLWTLILIVTTVLVGAIAGWALLVVETPADFVLHFAPPPVPSGQVRPMRSSLKGAKSHSVNVEKRFDSRVELPEGVAAKQLLSSVLPKYPEEAILRQISGAVSLTVLIDRSGSVAGVKDANGNRILVGAVERAVQQWRYRRFLFRGQAVETLVRVRFLFILPRR